MQNSRHKQFYQDAIQKFGVDDVRSLHWNSQKNQYARFQAIAQSGNFHQKSVLDLGCGRGDFYPFLRQQGSEPSAYTGIDFMPDFIEYAKTNYPSLDWRVGDFFTEKLTVYDFIVCNGALNVKQESNLAFLQSFILNMFPYFRQNMLITLLRYAKGYIANPLIHTYEIRDVEKLLSKMKISYRIKEDYADNDFLVIINPSH